MVRWKDLSQRYNDFTKENIRKGTPKHILYG